MININEWKSKGWSIEPENGNIDCFVISRVSNTVCKRCNIAGPWTLRIIQNGELAHRDYAVCRCGELRHIDEIWPEIQIPGRF